MKTIRNITTALALLCLSLAGHAATTKEQPAEVLLRFAVLGDAEPKPEPQFPHMAAAVADVNQLATTLPLDFVVGVRSAASCCMILLLWVLAGATVPCRPWAQDDENMNDRSCPAPAG